MKKFYINGKPVYMNNSHNLLSAKITLLRLSLVTPFDTVTEAPMSEQDQLSAPGPMCDEAAVESTVSKVEEFFADMLEDEDYDYYVLPNGKSAPYGLSGTELSAMRDTDVVYIVSLLQPCGFVAEAKGRLAVDSLLAAVDRDLIFASREKAVQAYNALFGDLYGEV